MSQTDVRNCRATRNTVLIQICNPSILCILLTDILPLARADVKKLLKKESTLSLCFSVIITILRLRSTENPRCRVVEEGSSLFTKFNWIPSQLSDEKLESGHLRFLCQKLDVIQVIVNQLHVE